MSLDDAGLWPAAKWVQAEGADAAAPTRSIPLPIALGDGEVEQKIAAGVSVLVV
ncbi:hypothetical protein FHS31_000326 [Sphingomonas vulcanisoli]|uniref:Uncharacterized protein n=1 Tax=Sphingomonas vulcanisoli TaxID=1658060 RepID=A0ABX0TMJ5_9SPHN|nr:hypothetical protein [Sphingomonas vulcanisoli]NIJ06744.1 hypothetical protein [Sphingomonas vulcanisoli]